MSETKHTPGPLTVECRFPNHEVPDGYTIHAPRGSRFPPAAGSPSTTLLIAQISSIFTHRVGPAEAKATVDRLALAYNAHDDLLAACELVAGARRGAYGQEYNMAAAYKAVDAAIAKATQKPV
jgi:hypothetical protein